MGQLYILLRRHNDKHITCFGPFVKEDYARLYGKSMMTKDERYFDCSYYGDLYDVWSLSLEPRGLPGDPDLPINPPLDMDRIINWGPNAELEPLLDEGADLVSDRRPWIPKKY